MLGPLFQRSSMYSLPIFLLCFTLLDLVVPGTTSPAQVALQLQPQPATYKKLKGRFLQITDLHPDPYYKVGSSTNKACHRKKPKKKSDRAGVYGTSFSECDSPFTLTNYTLEYLEKKWASEIDFVIWTGDNARHDNDRKLPRTPAEIYDLNRAVAAKMEKVFLKKGIPVIPSLGNNDVWPHNILTPGPNSITSEFSSIWRSFIPFPHRQVFQRGAYYSVEAIPDEIAVISLNTMYFYDSNKAVGGCNFREPDDPGNLQFDWLEVQLKLFRDRGMHVWLSGHVPPSPGNYFPECYVRYAELSLRFQDTILGHLYGHMNADHFFFVEAVDLLIDESADNGQSVHGDLCDALLDDFSRLPKPKDQNLNNYAVINVSPPVVPNPYLPTFRVFAYNVTGGHRARTDKKKGGGRKPGHHRGSHGNKTKQCKEERYRYSWKCQLNESWYSDPDAPSRTNTLWTPLGYAQYYVPDLTGSNETHRPDFKLEYTTFQAAALEVQNGEQLMLPKKEIPKKKKKKYTPYGLRDLTVGSWVGLASRLGDPSRGKLRASFRKYMYLGEEE